MKGVYFPGTGEAHLKEWPDPTVHPDDVLIKIKASALCRTDLSIYYGNPVVGKKAPGEVIPGHEPCGIITKTGKNAKHFKEGDRVVASIFVGCGFCKYCRAGEPNICERVEILGFDRHGGDAEFLVVPENVCLPMPDEMSYITGAISTDVIGNLYSTMKEMNVSGKDIVAIIGVGPMGLGGTLSAKGMGATVVALDLVDSRLNKAKTLGADYIVNAKEQNPVEFLMKLTNGEGVDKSVECSGTPEGVATCLDITRKHGCVAQIGEMAEAKIKPSAQFLRKKLTYYGSWYFYLQEWGGIADFIVNRIGNDKAEKMVSKRYSLTEQDISQAFKLFDQHKTDKVVFTP